MIGVTLQVLMTQPAGAGLCARPRPGRRGLRVRHGPERAAGPRAGALAAAPAARAGAPPGSRACSLSTRGLEETGWKAAALGLVAGKCASADGGRAVKKQHGRHQSDLGVQSAAPVLAHLPRPVRACRQASPQDADAREHCPGAPPGLLRAGERAAAAGPARAGAHGEHAQPPGLRAAVWHQPARRHGAAARSGCWPC